VGPQIKKLTKRQFFNLWKPDRDGGRRGRANFQQKIMGDHKSIADTFLYSLYVSRKSPRSESGVFCREYRTCI